MKDRFNFWVDLDIVEKGGSKISPDDQSRYDDMEFEGVASDGSEDADGEIMTPAGLDLSYFLTRGLFNLDHLTSRSLKNKSRFWIGEPISAKVDKGKLWVRGKLWKKSTEARAFWDKMLEMKQSGSSRSAGMSVEGKVIERDKDNPKKIVKALITNIALTFNPINFNTYADFAKAMQQEDFVVYRYPDSDVIMKGEDFWVDKDFSIHIER